MDFEQHLNSILPPQEVSFLLESLRQKPLYGLRTNTLKISSQELKNIFPFLIPHPIVKDAFLFDKEQHPLGKHPLHEAGAYYIQEPSAMLVSFLLNPQPGDHVIDLAAAPGGKATHAATLMNNEGIIWANDYSFSRAKTLRENVERMGFSNVIISSDEPSHLAKLFPGQWDKVILDAPCSGEGMFRKNKAVEDDWSYEKVISCSINQKDLILSAYQLLKKGGRLIYSTCTFSKEENEEVISYLLSKTNAKLINLPNFEQIDRGLLTETLRIYPHHFSGEGHFIALIESQDYFPPHPIPAKKPISKNNFDGLYKDFEKSTFSKPLSGVKEWLGDYFHLFPIPYLHPSNTPLLYKGISLGTLQKNRWIPSHGLSHALPVNNYQNIIDLTSEDSRIKAYLHGEEIPVENTLKGYCVVACHGLVLGWGRAQHGRLKNEFPKSFRHP